MKAHLLIAVALGEAILAPSHAQSPPSAPEVGPAASAPAGDARSGHGLYLRYGCQLCHGTSGQGAGQFGGKIAPNPLPFAVYARQLRRPRDAMPMYTHKTLTDQQVADIYAYLSAIPQAKKVEDLPMLSIK